MNIRTPVLFLIPARGGSKGIPRKNLARLSGRPLIAYVTEVACAAARTEKGGRVLVSTDDPEIADAARQFGAEAPFLRPAILSRDDTPSVEVVLHALDWLAEQEGGEPDAVVLLQPTSPLVAPDDVVQALALHQETQAPVVGVTAHEHPLAWSFYIEGGQPLEPIFGRSPSRRQDVRTAYRLNGAIYVATPDQLRRERSFVTAKTRGFVMPPERSADIDTAYDLRFAEWLLRSREEDA